MILPTLPAPWYQRSAALFVNLALLVTALFLISKNLPAGPPPVDAMAFFTPQDFTNYFTLVGAAIALSALSMGLVFIKSLRATPGQLLTGLRLVGLNGTEPTLMRILKRWLLSMACIVVIAVPGPAIAFIVGSVTASVLRVPFTTADRLLIQSGLPDVLRYSLHGLSFLALAAAVWLVFVYPAARYFEKKGNGLTLFDQWTSTTVCIRNQTARHAA